jgi:hypothetical protein
MVIQVMTVFVVPLFQAMWREKQIGINGNKLKRMEINGNEWK